MAAHDLCSHCNCTTSGHDEARLVRKCWYPGCVLGCPCVDSVCVSGARNRFTVGSDEVYKVHRTRPGDCPSCAGTGVGHTIARPICGECGGTGFCPECGGTAHSLRAA